MKRTTVKTLWVPGERDPRVVLRDAAHWDNDPYGKIAKARAAGGVEIIAVECETPQDGPEMGRLWYEEVEP